MVDIVLGGGAPVTVTFDGTTFTAVVSSRLGGTPTYQWQRSADGDSWSNIGGATSSTKTKVSADEENYVRVIVSGLTGTSSGTYVPDDPSGPTEVEILRRFDVDFTDFGSTMTFNLAVAQVAATVAVGADLAVEFMTNGIPVVSTVADEDGNLFTLDYESASIDSKKAYKYSRRNITNAPSQIIITLSSGSSQVRVYARECLYLGAEDASAGASLGTVSAVSHGVTTAEPGCLLTTIVNNSPSRTASATGTTTQLRLNYSGGSPYTGPLSEQSFDEITGQTPGAFANTADYTDGSTLATAFSEAYAHT